MFRIQLFGKFTAFNESGYPIRFESQSSACILALLHLRKGRMISRADLGEIIWPDSLPEQQRANLRKAISRLPKCFEESGLLEVNSEWLVAKEGLLESELEQAEECHRKYLQDRDSESAPELLEQFWKVIRVPMVEGWEQPWFESLRTRYNLWADEIGIELAEVYEDRGELEEASRIWQQVLADNPSRLEAVQGLLRTESAVHGNDHAQALVHRMLPMLSDSLVSAEIQKLLDAQKQLSVVVPPGQHLKKRGPILLLVHLFERNLQRGGTESLRLLASEVDSEFALQHPKVFLSLIDTALTLSSGWSEDRMTLMMAAMRLASRCCEFEIGHYWADEAIENGPMGSVFIPSAIVMKAFLYFEEREYAKSERSFERAGNHPNLLESPSTRSFYRAAYAGLLWQLGRFEQAIQIYEEEKAYGLSLQSDAGNSIVSRALTNLAYIAGARHDWDRCVEFGDEAVAIVGPKALNSMVLLGPLGSAKIQVGRVQDGIADLKDGLSATAEAGMKRYHQIAFDYAGTSVAKVAGVEIAQRLIDANSEHRQALRHYRSPAEIELLSRSGLMDRRTSAVELSRQSPRTLNKCLLECLIP